MVDFLFFCAANAGSQAFFALTHLESDASDAHQPPIDNEAASPLPLTVFCSAGSHGLIQVLLCQLPKSLTPCNGVSHPILDRQRWEWPETLPSPVNEIIRWLMATSDTGGEVEVRLDLIQ